MSARLCSSWPGHTTNLCDPAEFEKKNWSIVKSIKFPFLQLSPHFIYRMTTSKHRVERGQTTEPTESGPTTMDKRRPNIIWIINLVKRSPNYVHGCPLENVIGRVSSQKLINHSKLFTIDLWPFFCLLLFSLNSLWRWKLMPFRHEKYLCTRPGGQSLSISWLGVLCVDGNSYLMRLNTDLYILLSNGETSITLLSRVRMGRPVGR